MVFSLQLFNFRWVDFQISKVLTFSFKVTYIVPVFIANLFVVNFILKVGNRGVKLIIWC